MKHVSFRILSIVLALTISSALIYALSHAGKSTKGPIENAISYTGEAVKNIEQKLIVENRSERREDKLEWLKPYFKNKKLLESTPLRYCLAHSIMKLKRITKVL